MIYHDWDSVENKKMTWCDTNPDYRVALAWDNAISASYDRYCPGGTCFYNVGRGVDTYLDNGNYYTDANAVLASPAQSDAVNAALHTADALINADKLEEVL